MVEKQPTDWEAIEREFRAGQLSIREIAKNFGVSDTAIRKKAREHDWVRSLADKVNKAVRDQLVRTDGSQASSQTGSQSKASDREIIEAVAKRGADVVLSHRSSAARGQKLALKMFAELEEATEYRAEIQQAIEDETDADESSKRRTMMEKAVALPARSSVLVNLSNAIKTFVAIERQAFNLDAPADPDEPLKITRIERVIVDPADPHGP